MTVMEELRAKYDEALDLMSDVEIDEYVKEYVQNGIAVLKEKWGPDYVDHIDPLLLDLGSASTCVLGQLYDGAEPTDEQWSWLEDNIGAGRAEDGYMKGLAILNSDVAKNPHYFGFDSGGMTGYGELQVAWLEALREELGNR